VEPKLFYDYARNQRVSDIREHLLFPLKTLSIILPMGLAVVDLLLPVVIGHLFPAYLPGVPAMRVLVWGSVFMGLLVSTKSFIVAIGKQKKVLLFYIAAVLVHLAVSTTLAFYGWGLVGIATGTLVAYAVCATELLIFVFLKFGEPMMTVFRRIGSLYLPSALVFGVTVVVPFGLPKILPEISPNAVMAVEGVGIVLCCGVFYFSLRRYFREYLSWNLDKMCSLAPVIENVPPAETLI